MSWMFCGRCTERELKVGTAALTCTRGRDAHLIDVTQRYRVAVGNLAVATVYVDGKELEPDSVSPGRLRRLRGSRQQLRCGPVLLKAALLARRRVKHYWGVVAVAQAASRAALWR